MVQASESGDNSQALAPDESRAQPCSRLAPMCAGMVEAQIKGAFGEALLEDLLKERRSDRRWKLIRRAGLSVAFLISLAVYLLFYASHIGFRLIPKDDQVAIVKVEGTILDGQPASADKVIPVLKKAYEAEHVKAIVLSIESGGGAPQESERINKILDYYREQTKKPTVAIINGMGGSAAYMIALHADKIVAGEYSIVGSIGAILQGWDFHRAMERFDVKQRVFQSGKHKGMMNPYQDMSPESTTKAQQMVDGMAASFFDEVKVRRGNKLKPDVDYFTGEVWDGREAMKLGLIDEVDTLEHWLKKNYDGLKTYDYGPGKGGGFGLFSETSIPEQITEYVLRRIAPRSEMWLN